MKRKISSILAASLIVTSNTQVLDVFADEIKKKKAIEIERQVQKNMTVGQFKLKGSTNFDKYNDLYKAKISKITNNGGHYPNSQIGKAIDGNLSTHWETGKQNTSEFKNEVILELEELSLIDRIAYATRQDGAKGKGYPKTAQIYVSTEDVGDNFTSIGSVNSSVTGNMVEFKFDAVNAKRVKFVFEEAHNNWASASEIWIYKQDKISEKVENLFTDENKNKLTEEFNTLEELSELEKEAKSHPLYSDFKEKLDNAKIILNQEEIESTVATTKKFTNLDNESYIEKFKISNENIESISNNAGHYGSQKIQNAIDENLNTYWETNKGNSSTWNNEVTVEFKEPVTIDKVVYGARQSDRKGFMQEFEIYSSNTTEGETFQLVATGKADTTTGLVEANFNPTTFKRIKIKFVKSTQNWASINEIMFFKEDKLAKKVKGIFTDGLMNKLVSDYDTIEELETLETEIENHPIESELITYIDRAKEVLQSPEQTNKYIYELESRGDSIKESQKRQMWNFQDWQPTGLAVKSGQQITVYVDAKEGEPLPRLVYKQMDSRHNGTHNITLNNGKNIITIPTTNSSDLRPGTAQAGVLYTVNPYTTEQQTSKPKIKIEGAFEYPCFILGEDTDANAMEELKEYVQKLKSDDQLPDVFEIFSEKNLMNVRATYALDWYSKNNITPTESAMRADEILKEAMDFWGYDNSSEVNSDYNYRYVSMLKYLSNGVFMNAGNGITGYNEAQQGAILNYQTGWGLMHELGHNMDTTSMNIAEVTNNMLPLHFEMIQGQKSRFSQQNQYKKNIFPKVTKEDYSQNVWYPENDFSNLQHIAPLWQLQLYDETFWPRLQQEFRENKLGGGDRNNKHEAWAIASSNVLQLDLTEFFARHGFRVSEETKEHMKQYPEPTVKLWYMNDNKYLKDGESFNDNLSVEVTPKINTGDITLTMEIDKENNNSLLGYEIYRDGKLIGFTDSETYVDKEANLGENHIYEVVPFSNDLNTANKISVNSQQPTIETTTGVTLKLNEEFNPLDYVKCTDYNGNTITNIEVNNNVDNTKKGKYTVTYKVKDLNDLSVEKTLNVEVVSDYTYLSDIKWTSAVSGYKTARCNENIKGRELGEVKTFKKGLATHANGSITYNLGEHDYDYLEMKVGVDTGIAEQNNSSITFKVTGDGKTLATTSIMKHADNLKYIKIPVKGIDEIKIEVNDGGNGKTSDHGIIVEPKLTTNNAKPSITISNSQTVKQGETIEDIVGEYKALDQEDGNITSQVKITGVDKVNFNRVGKYPITFTVSDKDGNKVEKVKYINVVNMEDYKYLSDYDWESAKTSYGKVNKDKSSDGRTLTLTDENKNAIEYSKGIGTHAHSTIIYDLTDKNAELFTSYVGVDREMYNSPGSIKFEVYVDGEKSFDSGIMNAKDPKKYVEVDLSDAKELKLVVTDGGNGIASDHATWADAKLHYVNTNRVYKNDLIDALEDAKAIEKYKYTDESIEVLESTISKAEELLNQDNATQESIDSMTTEVENSINSLVKINFEETVNIPDKYLLKAINTALNKEGNVTIGDMYRLTTLNLSGVVNLEGLQYARNLETINGEYNEIKDLRPLSKLSKLKNINFKNQFVQVGEIACTDKKIKVNTQAYNRSGENIAKKVSIFDNKGNIAKEVILDNNEDVVSIDVSDLSSGFYRIDVSYEDDEISGTLMYMSYII